MRTSSAHSMTNPGIAGGSALAGLLFFIVAASATEPAHGAPTGDANAGAGKFVAAYGKTIQQVEYGVTPASVRATSGGGYIALASSDSPRGFGVNWLLKLDASGHPQWQRELGCATGAGGDYTLAASAQQSSDGGYVLGGGVLGCGSYTQRALVEKLDALGRVTWAFAYSAESSDTSITSITQTTDGGFVAVGSATDRRLYSGALILKLGSDGAVQWRRKLGPTASTTAYFNAVQQTSDGGYVAFGESSVIGGDFPYPVSVLVASFDTGGNLRWQKQYNNVDGAGAASGYEHALSGIQSADGGYVVAGNWSSARPGPFPQEDTAGGLVLRLDAGGNIEWQRAYNGGVYCYFNGFNQTCTILSVLVYSVHQAADGGYVLAGLGNLKLLDSVPQVPWLAKIDSAGNLLWQHFYYDVYETGRPISQYFASATPAPGGGVMALGFTEKNDITLIGELYAVKTDPLGRAGPCDQRHPATPLHAIDPGVTVLAASLPVLAPIVARSPLSISSRPTAVLRNGKCGVD